LQSVCNCNIPYSEHKDGAGQETTRGTALRGSREYRTTAWYSMKRARSQMACNRLGFWDWGLYLLALQSVPDLFRRQRCVDMPDAYMGQRVHYGIGDGHRGRQRGQLANAFRSQGGQGR